MILRSKALIAEHYSESAEDQKDWIRVICAAIGTLMLAEDQIQGGVGETLNHFFGDSAFFQGVQSLIVEADAEEDEDEEGASDAKKYSAVLVLTLSRYCQLSGHTEASFLPTE